NGGAQPSRGGSWGGSPGPSISHVWATTIFIAAPHDPAGGQNDAVAAARGTARTPRDGFLDNGVGPPSEPASPLRGAGGAGRPRQLVRGDGGVGRHRRHAVHAAVGRAADGQR